VSADEGNRESSCNFFLVSARYLALQNPGLVWPYVGEPLNENTM